MGEAVAGMEATSTAGASPAAAAVVLVACCCCCCCDCYHSDHYEKG
jgi:hypothetical protein